MQEVGRLTEKKTAAGHKAEKPAKAAPRAPRADRAEAKPKAEKTQLKATPPTVGPLATNAAPAGA